MLGILSYNLFFFFFLIIDLYFSNHAVITQVFIAAVEFGRPAGIPNKKAKAEMETHPVTVEAKISKCSV